MSKASSVLFTPVSSRLAHSSLGFHSAYAGLAPCERAPMPDDGRAMPRSLESGRGLGDFDVVWVTLAWELEAPAVARALRASGIEPVRSCRPPTDPLVVAGGPLTLSNPDLAAAFADAVFLGEADAAFADLSAAVGSARDRDDALARLAAEVAPGGQAAQHAVHGHRTALERAGQFAAAGQLGAGGPVPAGAHLLQEPFPDGILFVRRRHVPGFLVP